MGAGLQPVHLAIEHLKSKKANTLKIEKFHNEVSYNKLLNVTNLCCFRPSFEGRFMSSISMDHKEFSVLIKDIEVRLYRVARRILISHEEAQDSVQEVVIKIWERKDVRAQAKNIEAYAMTMIKNYCLDRLKSKQANFLRLEDDFADQLDLTEDTLSAQNDIKERLRAVEKVVNLLPEKQRTVWHLRDVEGYSFEEIEVIMDMNATAVRVTLSRARKEIRNQIAKQYE
jgi:RNA polymerase sigma-70 factor (ECF subfamily)